MPDTPAPCSSAAWKRHGVVLAPSEPWEGGFIQNFTSPAEPLEDGRWRLWYCANGPGVDFNLAVSEGVPGEAMTHTPAVLSEGPPADAPLAVGNLPSGWRPVQAGHVRLDDGRHRLYFWAHAPGVIRYLAAESDDGGRYRVLDPERPCLFHPMDSACGSGDKAPPEEIRCNDATAVYRLADGSYELYTAALITVGKDDPRYMPHDNLAGYVRVIDRLVSEDGLHWGGRKRVIEPDVDDPVDQQFYHLSVTHTPGGRAGMLGHYRLEAQTMDLEWCISTDADGLQWRRPARRGWLRRGGDDDGDSFGVYPPAGLVRHDGRWWLFYTGVNHAHNHEQANGPQRSVIMLATCDDVFA